VIHAGSGLQKIYIKLIKKKEKQLQNRVECDGKSLLEWIRIHSLRDLPGLAGPELGFSRTSTASVLRNDACLRLPARNNSSAYHSKTNGQTEKINAILKQYLKIYINFRQNNWIDWFPLAKFALNNAVSEITGFFPFFANYEFNSKLGFESRLPCSPNKTL
jgi:hypothetical protein